VTHFTALFRRVKHQSVYRCRVCEQHSRHIIRWLAKKGLLYPDVSTLSCPACGSEVDFGVDLYLGFMAQPLGYDPERARSEAVRRRMQGQGVEVVYTGAVEGMEVLAMYEDDITNLFGESVSLEAYLKKTIKPPSFAKLLADMPSEQMISCLWIMSQPELERVATSLVYRGLEGTNAEEDLYRAVTETMYYIGDPPNEAKLKKDPDPETKRFCRVRHQRQYARGSCGYTRRLVVTWTLKDGFHYPKSPECNDWVGMLQVRETYLPIMPPPLAFDPEPERTRAWRTL